MFLHLITQGDPITLVGRLTEWEHLPPLKGNAKRWRRSRDGCAGQYQGKKSFRGWQTMKARHGIEFEDTRKPSKHGKDIADGDGQVVGGMVKRSFNDDYGKGTQNLVRHLASKFKAPKTKRKTRYYGMKGLYSTTHYIYMYLPEDGIDETVVAVEKGYSGSSKDHYYLSLGKTAEASGLHIRERACGCPPCLKMMPDKCLLLPNSNFEAGINPPGEKIQLSAARPSAEVRHTRNARNPRQEFCAGLKVGDNVVVRIADEEREINPDEEYFVCKIEEKAIILSEAGMYSAVKFKKGDWIVKICWYVFCPSKQNRTGDRFYKMGYAQFIACGSIVRAIKPKDVVLRWSGGYYRPGKQTSRKIEDFGDLLNNN